MNALNSIKISKNGFIFNPETGESFMSNEIGILILNQLKNNISEKEICNLILNKYDVTQKEAERDLIDFTNTIRLMDIY